ncbi:MAG TPA: hypothetical protein VIE12_00060 [Actinomycetota bacterium]|jgi:hypothetical protein
MREPRVRVLVGEGQPARRGLFRFVLENEGYDVVAEAATSMELAQQLAIHRPDVVVLDDGIDATAVAMLREVQPAAKLILVWPRGVSAVGADARLEPSEVMHALGPTVARVTGGSGAVLTMPPPERPRMPVPDVIVVPEPEQEPRAFEPLPGGEAGPAAATPAPPAAAPEVRAPGEPATMFPPAIRTGEARPWTYAAPEPPAVPRSLRTATLAAAIAIVGVLAALALVLALGGPRTVRIQSLAGDVGDFRFPEQPEGTFTEPGTYEGVVEVQAQGSLRIRASGDIELRLDGTSRIVARGIVEVSGEGVVRNVNDHNAVRVLGSGTVRITIDGSVRLRIDGSISGSAEGTLRIVGDGTFLIHRAPR